MHRDSAARARWDQGDGARITGLIGRGMLLATARDENWQASILPKYFGGRRWLVLRGVGGIIAHAVKRVINRVGVTRDFL
jgi:hypothetical protein